MSFTRSSAYERLRRLPRIEPLRVVDEACAVDAPAVAEPAVQAEAPLLGLESLERRLLGETCAGLSLKQRLERLAGAAARRERERERVPQARPRPQGLEELVQGQRAQNALGEYFVIENDVSLESLHGQLSLSRLRLVAPGSAALLASDASLRALELGEAVFLDTETTGLAGGTGTAAFLIGLGFVDGERFRVRQYFMRDYHEEPALLQGLAEDLRRFRHVVTFNGKLFDLPLLETRYRMCRSRFPLGSAPHLDLLHPARRLWKARLESCRLQSLERGLLGLARVGDVPGEAIPGLYFDFVRRRDARGLVRVFEHNRTDVVSLFALSVLACQWVREDLCEHALDWLSLGRVLERAGLEERAGQAYERALALDEPLAHAPALMRLAARARRAGRWDEACGLWRRAAGLGEWRACRALAVYNEHRARDLREALRWTTRALARAASQEQSAAGERADLRRRERRLERKLLRAGSSAAQPVTASRNSTSS